MFSLPISPEVLSRTLCNDHGKQRLLLTASPRSLIPRLHRRQDVPKRCLCCTACQQSRALHHLILTQKPSAGAGVWLGGGALAKQVRPWAPAPALGKEKQASKLPTRLWGRKEAVLSLQAHAQGPPGLVPCLCTPNSSCLIFQCLYFLREMFQVTLHVCPPREQGEAGKTMPYHTPVQCVWRGQPWVGLESA